MTTTTPEHRTTPDGPTATDADSRAPAIRRPLVPRTVLVRVLPPLVLVALVLYFSVARHTFLSTGNFVSMGTSAGYLLAGSVGLTFVILAGSIDLSIGATVLLSSAVVALVVRAGGDSLPAAVGVTLAVGVLVGSVNGALTVYGRLPSFIVTLGTLSVFTGLALTILNGQSVSFFADSLLGLVNTQLVPGVTGTFLVGLVLFAVSWFLTHKTRFGLYVYAIGANEQAAKLAGVDARRLRFWLFVVSGVFAAVSGLLVVSGLQAAGPTLGTSFMLDAVAAVAVGGTSLAGGSGGVERTLVGVLILVVLSSGLNQLGVPDFTQTMIKGVVVAVAAALTIVGRKDTVVK